MSKQTTIEIIDDISGERLADGAGRTVTFGLEGVQYEIDLTHAHADELRTALEPWVAAARRVPNASRASGGSGRSGSTRTSRDVQAIREWATANGYKVATRGRIPAQVLEAYAAR